MTIGYLVRTKSVTLDANGNGKVVLAPDTGEYWAPNFVRVSTVSRAKSIAYCALYQGAINAADATTFIDETYLGNGDVSSIASGTIVQRGEAITAQWVGATAGDVAIVSLYGRVCDNLPEIANVLSTIPGARFQASNAATLTNIDTVYVPPQTVNLAANGQKNFGFNVYGANGVYIYGANNGPQAVELRLAWSYLTSGGSTNFDFVLPVGFSEPVEFIVPVLSSTAVFGVVAPTASNASVDIVVTSARQGVGIPQGLPDKNILFSRTNIAIGGSATDTFESGRTWLGRATWHVHSSVATWTARLQVYDKDGNLQDISFRNNSQIQMLIVQIQPIKRMVQH